MNFIPERFNEPPTPLEGLDPLKKHSKRHPLIIIAGITAAIVAVAIASLVWYASALRPVDKDAVTKVTVTVEQGMTPVQIGQVLQSDGLIHSLLAFRIYAKLHQFESKFQAGTYRIAPSQDLASIVDTLMSGKTSTFNITFFPGSTLFDPTDTPDAKRSDVYTMLRRAGYTDKTIRAALDASYESPLFAGKPDGTSLEGYVYGETYQFATNASVNDVLKHTFEIYYQKLEDNNIPAGIKKQGLNLYQAITLASIIQREVSGYQDMRKVAQVFYTRLKKGMPLGSDVTFIYAANQANQTPTVDFDSPYNTRIHKGLPPGPISNPGIDALKAVADPAPTDYLYFVAGEDGKTYFSRTAAEHEKNVAEHCGDLCK